MRLRPLLAEKVIRAIPSVKVLVELFQKLEQMEGAKPSSRSAEREISVFANKKPSDISEGLWSW